MKNWKIKLIWITMAVAAFNMVACGQKKEDNNGRPPLAPGVTPGKDAKTADATTVSKMPVIVDQKLVEAQVSDIHALKNTSDDTASSQISLTVSFNGQAHNLVLSISGQDPQTGSYESGDYTISYTSVCTKACAKLYFVAKVTNRVSGKDQSQIAVVKFLDGSLFFDDESQKSLSTMGEQNIKSVQELIKLLDEASMPKDSNDTKAPADPK